MRPLLAPLWDLLSGEQVFRRRPERTVDARIEAGIEKSLDKIAELLRAMGVR